MSDRDLNLRHWSALFRTDPQFTKPFESAGGFKGTSTAPTFMYLQLTEHFGPVGIGWGWEDPIFHYETVKVPASSNEVTRTITDITEYGPDTVKTEYTADEETGERGYRITEGPLKEIKRTRTEVTTVEPPRDIEIKLLICQLKCWYRDGEDGERNYLWGYGGDRITKVDKRGVWHDDDSYKKIMTDAIGNAFSRLGAGADIRLGLEKDVKYLSATRQDFESNEVYHPKTNIQANYQGGPPIQRLSSPAEPGRTQGLTPQQKDQNYQSSKQ